MGGLQSAGLPPAEEGVGAAQRRHRRNRYRPAGAAVVVNPDPDGRGGAGDAAEQPWCRSERHPSARSHDRRWLQQPSRSSRRPLKCTATYTSCLSPSRMNAERDAGWLIAVIAENGAWN